MGTPWGVDMLMINRSDMIMLSKIGHVVLRKKGIIPYQQRLC